MSADLSWLPSIIWQQVAGSQGVEAVLAMPKLRESSSTPLGRAAKPCPRSYGDAGPASNDRSECLRQKHVGARSARSLMNAAAHEGDERHRNCCATLVCTCLGFVDTCLSFVDTCLSFVDTCLIFLDTCLSSVDTCLSFVDTCLGFVDICRHMSWKRHSPRVALLHYRNLRGLHPVPHVLCHRGGRHATFTLVEGVGWDPTSTPQNVRRGVRKSFRGHGHPTKIL